MRPQYFVCEWLLKSALLYYDKFYKIKVDSSYFGRIRPFTVTASVPMLYQTMAAGSRGRPAPGARGPPITNSESPIINRVCLLVGQLKLL